jgi:hypothetical protein
MKCRHKKTGDFLVVAPRLITLDYKETHVTRNPASDTPGHPAKFQTQTIFVMSYRTLQRVAGFVNVKGSLLQPPPPATFVWWLVVVSNLFKKKATARPALARQQRSG